MSRQSEGGKARARNLSKERRSEIAQTAAAARWAHGNKDTSEEVPPEEEIAVVRRHLHCGAALIRSTLNRLPMDERKTFILTLWPDLHERLAMLIARFPNETRVYGAQLQLPPSWSVLTEEE